MTNAKKLLILACPITVILFILFTKWWIAFITDGPDYVMYGFPLIYKSPAFHTSMAQQYFVMELFIDFLVYFTIVSAFLFSINKFIFKIKLKKKLIISIYLIATLLLGIEILFATVFETSFSIRRDFGTDIKQTGFKFYFSERERQIYNQSHQ